MLQTLRIRNLALIDDVELEFDAGFNVLTGETGAGKSIVVGALNLILGGRASADHVQSGANEARIEALFHFDAVTPRLQALFDEHGIEPIDGELLLVRVVLNNGRSRAYAAGNLTPLNTLEAIGAELVDLHGQHEHQSLLKTIVQLELVDAFGGLSAQAQQMAERYGRSRTLDRDIAALEGDDRERARQIEFRRFEVAEIEKANLVAGEETELKSRRNLVANAERIHALATTAYTHLYAAEDEPAAVDAVDAALKALEELATIDASFALLLQQLSDARSALEAIAAELRRDEFSFDPRELDDINGRLSMIRDLARKYGDSTEEILAFYESAKREIAAFEHRDERLDQLRAQRAEALEAAQKFAADLSKRRRAAAKKLDKDVSAAIALLGMEGAQFHAGFHDAELSAHGTDKIEFMLAANLGEPPKPLRKVASGGEMSRLMLALKTAFATADKVPTLIFDEIDAGIGGAVAGQVADCLAALGESHQVICVTHLPQIAAAARRHFNVSKKATAGRTRTEVRIVEDASRIDEVARLLDGKATALSLQHAEALLRKNAS